MSREHNRAPRAPAQSESGGAEGQPDHRPPAEGEAPEQSTGAAEQAAAQPAERAGGVQGHPAGYRVQLDAFEGPLDLLLHLIQQHELDIMDIPMGFVTERYLAYIKLMQELNIDLASEYLVMAASLTHIKSKMLLPSVPEDQEEGELEEEDPRAELVRRLLEYQKYKEAAAELGDRSVLGRDVFVRGMPIPAAEGPAPLAPVSLFKLLDAFQAVMGRAQIRMDHEVEFERFSITERIAELADVLRDKQRVNFEDLFTEQQSRSAMIVTFLALLEMTRLRMTRLMQAGPLDPIIVELAVVEDEQATVVTDGSSEADGAEREEPTGETEQH